MIVFEYQVIECDKDYYAFSAMLTEMCLAGWEIVSVEDFGSCYRCTFNKRRK
jgi:hypothetical protein